MATEPVFEILAEGGSLRIFRKRTKSGERFLYAHNEMDPTDEGLDVNGETTFESFEEPFQVINNSYPWFQLHLESVHEDYKKYVLDELIKVLTKKGVSPDELRYNQGQLEKQLGVQLHFGNAPITTGMQNITVENLTKFTSFEHHTHRDSYDSPVYETKYVPKAQFETWLTGSQTFYHDQCNMSCGVVDSMEIIGTLEVSGNTIIIRNEFGQIAYIFSSDKFFVTTSPVLSKSKSWFYTYK